LVCETYKNFVIIVPRQKTAIDNMWHFIAVLTFGLASGTLNARHCLGLSVYWQTVTGMAW